MAVNRSRLTLVKTMNKTIGQVEVLEVSAALSIEMYVDCPNDDCGSFLDLLDERDTDGTDHNEEGQLMRQIFPPDGSSHDDFECRSVVCKDCKTEFKVKGLEW